MYWGGQRATMSKPHVFADLIFGEQRCRLCLKYTWVVVLAGWRTKRNSYSCLQWCKQRDVPGTLKAAGIPCLPYESRILTNWSEKECAPITHRNANIKIHLNLLKHSWVFQIWPNYKLIWFHSDLNPVFSHLSSILYASIFQDWNTLRSLVPHPQGLGLSWSNVEPSLCNSNNSSGDASTAGPGPPSIATALLTSCGLYSKAPTCYNFSCGHFMY